MASSDLQSRFLRLYSQHQRQIHACIAWGIDPHDSFRREFNKSYRQEIIEGAPRITFGMTSGDLDYMGWENGTKNPSHGLEQQPCRTGSRDAIS